MYYIAVIFANVIAALLLQAHLRITLVSVLIAVCAVLAILDLAFGKKLARLDYAIYHTKYRRHSNDPTDENGFLAPDKEALDAISNATDKRYKKMQQNSTFACLIVIPLLITPFLFFTDIVKCILMLALTALISIIGALLNRRIIKEIESEQKARSEELRKELEEQKKREELGKWK